MRVLISLNKFQIQWKSAPYIFDAKNAIVRPILIGHRQADTNEVSTNY